MSGAIGKGATSLKKDTDQPSLIPQVGFKSLRFMHSATAGDKTIDLQALTTPTAATANGFVQPSASDLAATNIFEFKNNLELKSSLRTMTQFIDYVITGAQTIALTVEAQEGEIFTGVITAAPRTGSTLVDASATPITGTLAAGTTDFSSGPYEVGKNAGAQHGSHMIYADGQLMYRNFGNQPDGEGDYYELAGIIRFNNTDPNDRDISMIPIGAIVEQPDGSQIAAVEAVNSKIDAVIPTVAALAGVPESDFGITPTNADLKAFGDGQLQNTQNIDLAESRLDTLEAEGLVVEADDSAFTLIGGTTNQFQDLASIVLTPGEWDIEGIVGFDESGGAATQIVSAAIASTPGNTTDGGGPKYVTIARFVGAVGDTQSLYIPTRKVVVETNTTFYIKGKGQASHTNLTVNYYLRARRIGNK